MMKKKWIPHVLAAVALALFVGLGLASDGTTPAGGGCPMAHTCSVVTDAQGVGAFITCRNARCAVASTPNPPPPNISRGCTC